MSKRLTQKISKLWLTGIKSVTKCEEIIEVLEDRCINLNELEQFEFRVRNGTIYGIAYIGIRIEDRKWQNSDFGSERTKVLKKMRDFTSYQNIQSLT